MVTQIINTYYHSSPPPISAIRDSAISERGSAWQYENEIKVTIQSPSSASIRQRLTVRYEKRTDLGSQKVAGENDVLPLLERHETVSEH